MRQLWSHCQHTTKNGSGDSLPYSRILPSRCTSSKTYNVSPSWDLWHKVEASPLDCQQQQRSFPFPQNFSRLPLGFITMGWVANATPEVDAQSQWATILAVCIVLSVLSIATVSCRLWIRGTARGLAGDDYMSGLSMIFAFIYSILCIVQTKYGLGLPLKLRPKANIGPYSQVNFAGRPIYQIGISFFKIALLISYLRLLQGTDRKVYRMVVWTTIVIVFLAHLGCTLSLVFACTPVEKSWKPWVAGSCLQPGPSFTGYAVVTIVSDIVVAVLPIPVLLKLNVRPEKKLGLIGIFMLGLFTTLCSIMRYVQIDRIQNGDGNSTMLVLWGTIEFNVGVSLCFLRQRLCKHVSPLLTRFL